jgi:energy-coupling factor transporter ATP-binding protein EcfA2
VSSGPSRSRPDPFAQALGAAVDAVAEAVRFVAAANPVVLIDGRSGAGKTSFARMLVARWPQHGRVQLVALDSLYPGWDGLAEGVEYARTAVLVPHARGMVGVWQRWDWEACERAEAHAVDPSLPLIVEGSGLLSPRTTLLGDVRVWLDAPEEARRRRALARDGDSYRPHWERWAAQEDAHLAADDPVAQATVTVALP